MVDKQLNMSHGFATVFEADKFHTIVAGLQNYRIDYFIRLLEKKKGSNSGNILPFIRGLRFSALLIYAIRELLSHTDLQVSWGHILDKNEQYCSKECDIIIHKKGVRGRWNGAGNGESIMDFKFIDYKNAIAVISCKSFLSRTAIEIEYCKEMKSYVDKVWLFAECCGPKSADLIEAEAKKYGYENFWYLYSFNKSNGETQNNLNGWTDFVKKIKLLA